LNERRGAFLELHCFVALKKLELVADNIKGAVSTPLAAVIITNKNG
jgi:hypothetical protein